MSDDPETVNAQDATDMPEVSAPSRVVGIGASAGGLEAFSELLRHLPRDTGMSFVFVQHLEPKQTSRLTEILSRITEMPVEVAADGVRMQARSTLCDAARSGPDSIRRYIEAGTAYRYRWTPFAD